MDSHISCRGHNHRLFGRNQGKRFFGGRCQGCCRFTLVWAFIVESARELPFLWKMDLLAITVLYVCQHITEGYA